MATRSAIGIEKDGKILAAYCHYDGYLEGNGDVLYKHYQDSEKILKLVMLGDMSTLDEEVAPPVGMTHSYSKPLRGVTVYYGRDRGEDGGEFREFNTREEMIQHYWDCEYFYIWTDNHWIYSQGRQWADLAQAIAAIEAEESN